MNHHFNNLNDESRSLRRKSSAPVEDKAAKEAAKNKMFAALSRKTGLSAKEVFYLLQQPNSCLSDFTELLTFVDLDSRFWSLPEETRPNISNLLFLKHLNYLSTILTHPDQCHYPPISPTLPPDFPTLTDSRSQLRSNSTFSIVICQFHDES